MKKDSLPLMVSGFEEWYLAAEKAGQNAPYAFVLSTVLNQQQSTFAQPDARVVYMRHLAKDHLTFFTNYNSAKAKAIAQNPKVCALFFWQVPFERQVRIWARAEKSLRKISVDYFHQRPKASQISAYISAQSEPIGSYAELVAAHQQASEKFADKEVHCPEHWGGYDLYFERFEFWQAGQARLHERTVYTFNNSEPMYLAP